MWRKRFEDPKDWMFQSGSGGCFTQALKQLGKWLRKRLQKGEDIRKLHQADDELVVSKMGTPRTDIPSGTNIANWKITIFNGKIHYFYGHFQ